MTQNIFNISNISDENESMIRFKDIYAFYKDQILLFDKIASNIITSIIIPEKVILKGRLLCFDIFEHNKMILLGLSNSPVKSWYKISKIEDVDKLINFYTKQNDTGVYSHKEKVLLNIGDNNFEYLIRYIYGHSIMEKTISDNSLLNSNKIKDSILTYNDKIKILENFIKSNPNNFYIRTAKSKSLLYFEHIENEIYLTINYNQIKIRNRYDPFDKYLPIDISIGLNDFELITFNMCIETILDSNFENPIKILYNINKSKCIEYINSNKSILPKTELLTNIIAQYEIDKLFHEIDQDKIFKAFENSFDILLRTIYERIIQPEINFDNHMEYINMQIIQRIHKIIESKILY
jgi:hypothetical protein